MLPPINPAGPPRSIPPSSAEPFVPDLSEGAETGVYLALLELLDEGLIITGDEVIIDANSAACRLLERDYRQIAGRPLAEIFPSERAFLEARTRLFIQGEMRGSLRVALPGGRHRDFRFIAAARLRPGIHALILSRDWLAETAPESVIEAPVSARQNDLWPRLAAALSQPVIVLDAAGVVAAANAAALALSGLDRAAFIGRPVEAALAIDWAADGAPLAQVRPAGGAESLMARILAGPHPGWRLLVLPAPGNMKNAVPAMMRNAAPVLSDGGVGARAPAADVFEAAGQAMFVCDGAGRIAAVNRAFAALTGYSREEAVGKEPSALGLDSTNSENGSAMRQVLAETGQWQGEIVGRRKDGAVYPGWLSLSVSNDAPAAESQTGVLTDLSARNRAEARGDYPGERDVLTGLPGRQRLARCFSAAAGEVLSQHRRSVGVLCIRPESFDAIRREYGANAGDAVLRQTARRLLAVLPSGARAAREDGDTFFVLLPGLEQENEALRAAGLLLAALDVPFETGQSLTQAGAGIGVALFPADGDTFDILCGRAEAALLRARQGGGGCQRYTPDLDGPGIMRRVFETRLRHAIGREELAVHFQPLVDARDGRVCAGEALLRWQHPDLGLVPFRSFGGVARDSGLISSLGDWALRTACLAAAGWKAAAGGDAPVVTVNIAIEQIMQPGFAGRVQQALADAALPPARLELDIDEQILGEDGACVADTLATLAGLGVRLAVDDFGRGASAIPKLKRYPLQALKLDPALVRDVGRSEESEAIVEAIASMADVLGLRIFARGVEDGAQQAFLSALGCHLQQGPLFGKPMTQAEFASFLAGGGI